MKKRKVNTYLLLIWFSLIPFLQKAQCPAVNVPYFENFSSITVNNQFPACWNSTNPGVTCLSFAAPLQCAAFHFSPAATSHIFTKAVQLNSGVNYSVGIWYRVSNGAPGNWSNLSIQLGTNQSSLGLSPIVSTSGVLINNFNLSLSSTFSVGSSGIYFFSISATGSPTASAQYLYWDDFEVTAPCSINPMNLQLVSSQTAVCAGQCLSLTASGADQYIWNNGSTGTLAVYCPTVMSTIQVAGTNTASGCTFTANANVNLNPSPVVSAIANPSLICLGTSAQLQAFGADTYTWSSLGPGNPISVSPQAQTVYTVTGSNSFGCQSSGTVTVKVSICSFVSDNLQVSKAKIFPNPLKDRFYVEFEAEQELELQMIDVQGRVVLEFKGKIIKENFSISHLNSGIYTLKLETRQGRSYQKLIKD